MTAEPPEGRAGEEVRSLEVRWIFPGRLETAVTGWFGRFPIGTESREDSYLLDPRLPGLSVKIRGGRALEVKMYHGSPGILEVAGRARGRLESWQKWSFPVSAADQDSGSPLGWRPVRKRRRIAHFSLAGGQIVARALGAGPGAAVRRGTDRGQHHRPRLVDPGVRGERSCRSARKHTRSHRPARLRPPPPRRCGTRSRRIQVLSAVADPTPRPRDRGLLTSSVSGGRVRARSRRRRRFVSCGPRCRSGNCASGARAGPRRTCRPGTSAGSPTARAGDSRRRARR